MPSQLPKKKAFQKSTSKLLAARKSIAAIDAALDQWHAKKDLGSTIQVYKACRDWLTAKEGKTSKSAAKRRGVIQNVLGLSMEWIFHFKADQFSAKKQKGVRFGRKAMSGVYKHERTTYLKNNKTFAPSATVMHGKMQAGDFGDSFGNKSFSQLTEAEYQRMDKMIKEEHGVLYMKKAERLKNMITIESGLLKTFDGSVLDDTTFQGAPYAIDVYGNIFAMFGKFPSQQFNHSTFNAGNDVICAGMMKVDSGKLKMISNNSGHYKPGRKELFNAVRLLFEEMGSNSKGATVEFWDFEQEPGQVHIWEFPIARFRQSGTDGGTHVHSAPA